MTYLLLTSEKKFVIDTFNNDKFINDACKDDIDQFPIDTVRLSSALQKQETNTIGCDELVCILHDTGTHTDFQRKYVCYTLCQSYDQWDMCSSLTFFCYVLLRSSAAGQYS